ncbi:MAG: hypothetical protein V4772_08875 [Pseudomonadota bacterium]
MNISQTIKAAGKQGAHRPFANARMLKDCICEHCDGTGHVHRADGEWLGTCACVYWADAVLLQAQTVGLEFDSESIEQGEPV